MKSEIFVLILASCAACKERRHWRLRGASPEDAAVGGYGFYSGQQSQYNPTRKTSTSAVTERATAAFEAKPFFDDQRGRWICPEVEQRPQQQQRLQQRPRRDRSLFDNTSVVAIESELMAADAPFTVFKAKQLDDLSSNATDFNEVLQRVTGIEIQRRPHHVRASAFSGFRRRKNATTTSSSNVLPAQPAFCQPEMQTVAFDLPASSPTSVFYYPTCTRIERCGGCCSHELLECQPVQVSSVRMKVIRTEFSGGEFKYAGDEIVTLERHDKCACDCRVKAQDCNEAQVYLPHECRCMCKNINAEHVCNSRPMDRYWDPKECKCRCKNVHECSTGMIYDHGLCRCARNGGFYSSRRRTTTRKPLI